MKKIFLMLFLMTTISTKGTKAQNGVLDTLVYLQVLVSNKASYIGKPFSFLANNLKLQIKYFHPRRGFVYDTNKETSTHLGFYFPQSAEEMYLTYPCLSIYWQTPLNANQSFALYNANDGGGWNIAVYDFYKNAIIKDIQVRD